MLPLPWFRMPLILLLGGSLLWWLSARATRNRQVCEVVLLSFLLRALLGISLYLISYMHWPVGESLQLGGGFWTFGVDAIGYDRYGHRLLSALTHGEPLAYPGTAIEYYLVLAGVYGLLGSHPLCGIVLNGWLGAANALLAYLIGRRLFLEPRRALVGAGLVAFWPSSMIWSAQLLKDSLGNFLVFGVLSVAILAIQEDPTRRAGRVRWVLYCLALTLVMWAASRLRYYVGTVFSLGALVAFGTATGLILLRRRSLWRAVPYLGVLVAIVSGTLLAREIKPSRIFFPAQVGEDEQHVGHPQDPVQGWHVEGPRLLNHAAAVAYDMTPTRMSHFREGFVSTGGRSVIDAQVNVSGLKQLLAYVPRALTIGFLAPFPWQWFDRQGGAGGMRALAGIEMVLVYLLVPAMVMGLWRLVKEGQTGGWFLITVLLLAVISLSIVVANVGALFRLRLQFLLPWLVVAACGDPVKALHRLWGAITMGRFKSQPASGASAVSVSGVSLERVP